MKVTDKDIHTNLFTSIVTLICGITVVIPTIAILWVVLSLLFSY